MFWRRHRKHVGVKHSYLYMPPRTPSKIRSRVPDQWSQLKNNMCNIRTTWIRTHRLFIVLKDFPGLFQVTSFFQTLPLQVAFQQLLKHTVVGAFVSQNAVGCLTGQEHWSWGQRWGYSEMRYTVTLQLFRIGKALSVLCLNKKGNCPPTWKKKILINKKMKHTIPP